MDLLRKKKENIERREFFENQRKKLIEEKERMIADFDRRIAAIDKNIKYIDEINDRLTDAMADELTKQAQFNKKYKHYINNNKKIKK